MNETEKRPEGAPEPELTTKTPRHQEKVNSGLVPSCLGGESAPPAPGASSTAAVSHLAEELGRMQAEPLLPIEKKLIAGSLILGVTLLLLLLWASRFFAPVAAGATPQATPAPPATSAPAASPAAASFRFMVVSDLHKPEGFRAICRTVQRELGGPGSFLVSPGDEEPPDPLRKIIDAELGTTTVWYPVVGNHNAAKAESMSWIREAYTRLPAPVHPGPAGCETTTYSFDRGDAHFVVINEYYDGKTETGADGNVVPELYDWLAADLERNQRPWVFVIGHEPAFPQPDARFGKMRHAKDSLNAHPQERDRFWKLLEERGVTAYVCGHTHYYSRWRQPSGRVWQINDGAALGAKEDAFLNITVGTTEVRCEVWRDYDVDGKYQVEDQWSVAAGGAAAATGKPATGEPRATAAPGVRSPIDRHAALCEQALRQLLDPSRNQTEEFGRFSRIVETLRAHGDKKVELLIRSAGNPAQDQSQAYDLDSGKLTPISEPERRGLYQFIALAEDARGVLTISAANLCFNFTIQGDAATFRDFETLEITPPETPPAAKVPTDAELLAIACAYLEGTHPDWAAEARRLPLVVRDAGAAWEVSFALPEGTLGGAPVVEIEKATRKAVRAYHTQ